MRQHWDDTKYPRLVYVETTNACDARCSFCLYERMERPVEIMKLDAFKTMANKVKAANLKIGAVFCFGEPLLDKEATEGGGPLQGHLAGLEGIVAHIRKQSGG